ncbi:MAG: Rne/Rng family ribonuclease, partial [Clostridia bacterium]
EKAALSNVGNIYIGRVVNVVMGIQAAFVDIGLKRNAYFNFGDICVDKSQLDTVIDQVEYKQTLYIKEGDNVLVQVAKDESGAKGARITNNITIAGRYLVLLPNMNYIGVSHKIEDSERKRLAEKIDGMRNKEHGYIIRTAAALATKKQLQDDIDKLTAMWTVIKRRGENAQVQLIHKEDDLAARIIRDILSNGDSVIVNTEQLYERFLQQVEAIGIKCEVKLNNNGHDIFELYGINDEIEKLMNKKVILKSGAYLIIDKTEALTIIDINSGSFTESKNLEETAFATNIEASKEIVRQLKLRNIGGIVIVDFIDMEKEEHQQAVLEQLRELFKSDRIKTVVVGLTGLGLVEITRKKSRNETTNFLKQECPFCKGEGWVYTEDYLISKIRVAILEILENSDAKAVIVTLNPTVLEGHISAKRIMSLFSNVFPQKRIYVLTDNSMPYQEFKVTKA